MDKGKKNPLGIPVSGVNGQPIPLNGGRKKGVPNKRTILARQAIADFVDGNAERLVEWLDRVADEKPEEAFKLFMSVVEYHVPKLARTEVVGDPDQPLELRHSGSLKDKLLSEIPEERLKEIIAETKKSEA
jgi:hypothetical protein